MTSGSAASPVDALLAAIGDVAGRDRSDARSLPPEAYTSPKLLELEREKIFRRDWICVGRADEIPETGDYFTTEVDRVPVVVVRRGNAEIGAMANVCRHHYAQVARGEGNARHFTCPYHAWSYDLDGRLIAAPRMPDNGRSLGCRLPAVQTETWGGFIYVNLDPEAAPLAPRLEGLAGLIGNYHLEDMRTVWHRRYTWNTNWKVLTENFLEAYHIPVTHKDTLLPIAPVEGIRMLPGGDGYCFYEHRMSIEPTPLDPGIAIPNPDLTDHEYRHAYIGGIYPTHVFSVTWDFVFWLSLQPDGPARVIIDWGIAGPVNLPKNQPDYPNFPYPALIEQVNEEDRMRVESVQRGAESGFARQGSMNHHEETIWYWAQYLHGRLAA